MVSVKYLEHSSGEQNQKTELSRPGWFWDVPCTALSDVSKLKTGHRQ